MIDPVPARTGPHSLSHRRQSICTMQTNFVRGPSPTANKRTYCPSHNNDRVRPWSIVATHSQPGCFRRLNSDMHECHDESAPQTRPQTSDSVYVLQRCQSDTTSCTSNMVSTSIATKPNQTVSSEPQSPIPHPLWEPAQPTFG